MVHEVLMSLQVMSVLHSSAQNWPTPLSFTQNGPMQSAAVEHGAHSVPGAAPVVVPVVVPELVPEPVVLVADEATVEVPEEVVAAELDWVPLLPAEEAAVARQLQLVGSQMSPMEPQKRAAQLQLPELDAVAVEAAPEVPVPAVELREPPLEEAELSIAVEAPGEPPVVAVDVPAPVLPPAPAPKTCCPLVEARVVADVPAVVGWVLVGPQATEAQLRRMPANPRIGVR
jgi:hypothetical protein